MLKFWGVRLSSLVAGVGGCLLIEYFARHSLSSGPQRYVVLVAIYVTLAVSLNLINGITGQFSIGHAAFYQVGAYTAGFLTLKFFPTAHVGGLLWLGLMIVAGAAAAAIAGFVVGLPSLRLRGDYLAIVTLGFGEIIRIIVQNSNPLGGSYGLNIFPKLQYIWIACLLAVICIAVCRNLLKTAQGLQFLAVREDEVASSAMGVNVTRTKVMAFLIGSAFAGAAGAVLAHWEGFLTPKTFDMEASFMILTMVVLGGTGSITGSAVAAAVLFYFPEYLRGRPPVTAAAIVATAIAAVILVVVWKRIADRYHQGAAKKFGMYVLGLVGAVIVQFLLAKLFSTMPAMTAKSFEAGQLRMVIFSASLIFLMLLRPEGVFGHHEFSWAWVAKILRIKQKAASEGVA